MSETDFTFEVWASFWVVATMVGILGNMLTLVSVTYAKSRKRHNLHNSNGLSSTMFILNLAVVDLLYCLVSSSMLMYALLMYVKPGWFNIGEESTVCKFYVLCIQELATIDGWSIALIAFSHAFPRIRQVALKEGY